MGDRLYHCWHDMHRRCTKNPKYIEKGIWVCPEWAEFAVFKKWAKKNGYRKKLTLDRIDNNKGYSPENCRWATPKVQGNNKGNNIQVEYSGETHTLFEWSAKVGISSQILYSRIHNGWDLERVFTQPVRRSSK
jgi:hypothetical protein